MDDDGNEIEDGELTSRAPTQEDFVGLCARSMSWMRVTW
jgi:hypothetical protein